MKYTSLIFIVAVLIVASAFGQRAETSSPVLVSLPKIAMPKDGYGSGGTVMVRVAVNESGEVTNAEFAKGPGPVCNWVERPDIVVTRKRAVELARQAKFTPAMSGGIPVAATALVAIEFVPSNAGKTKMQTEPVLGEYSGPVVRESKTSTPTLIGSEASKGNTSEKLVLGVYGKPDDGPRPEIPAGQGASPSDVVKTADGDTVSGGVLNGKAFSLPKPKYPAAARAVRAGGPVQVQVLIDDDGTVFSAAATGGHPLLQSASVTAACSARFTPTLLAGQPVKVSGIIVYNFVP